jgi:hypothetical protein
MTTTGEVTCPKCGAGNMWNNIATKTNPKAPDYKCRDRSCDGVIWPPKGAKVAAKPAAPANEAYSAGPHIPGLDAPPPPVVPAEDVREELLRKLGALHKRCLMFVLGQEVPLLEEAKVGGSPESVSALTAQLFISATNNGLHR